MERTEYRQSSLRNNVRSSARQYANMPQNSEMLETVLTQCIISGVVLLVILLLCLVKTDFTQNIRMSLKIAIAGETKLEDIKSVFNFPSSSAPVENTSVLPDSNGYEIYTDEAFTDEAFPDETPIIGEAGIEDASNVTEGFRIDEDILSEINSRTDPYGESLKN